MQNSPRRVDALARETVTAVSAAKYTTFAITSDGVLYAWGVGRGGRLGTGDERTHLLPVAVRGPLRKRRVAIVATAKHHTLAATVSGQLYSGVERNSESLGTIAKKHWMRTRYALIKVR